MEKKNNTGIESTRATRAAAKSEAEKTAKEAPAADRLQMVLAGKRKKINRGSDDDPK